MVWANSVLATAEVGVLFERATASCAGGAGGGEDAGGEGVVEVRLRRA